MMNMNVEVPTFMPVTVGIDVFRLAPYKQVGNWSYVQSAILLIVNEGSFHFIVDQDASVADATTLDLKARKLMLQLTFCNY